MNNTKCSWHLEDYNYGQWESDCGLVWYMSNDNMPRENQMNFCPKCGKALVEELEECL